jgi:hypothetical protein
MITVVRGGGFIRKKLQIVVVFSRTFFHFNVAEKQEK